MKKIFTTTEYKNLNTVHAKKSLLSKLRLKQIRKKKNILNLGKSEVVRITESNHKYKYYDYVKAVVPTNFSFLTNPSEVIKFISNLKNLFNGRKKVFVVMRNVNLIDNSAIVVLLSIMIRFKSQKIRFNGDFPNDPSVAKIFKDSGFFEALRKDDMASLDRYKLGKPRIYTHAWKNVDPELSKKIMEDISMCIQGQKVVYKGLHRTLIELMQNSYNHANPLKEGEKHWWLSVNVNSVQRIASFSFIDYGVGIFESLNNKTEGSKWFHWKEKIVNAFSYENNSDILKLILNGDLHKTVTGDYFRGKGLPGIKEAMDRNLLSKLHIITNDVYANITGNIFKKLPHNFEGTFVYWEINELTEYIPWTL